MKHDSADPNRDVAFAAMLRDAVTRALPLLARLGDFIGNGDVDPNNPISLGVKNLGEKP